jgi:small conductance mechanosensitive channel
LRVIWSKLETWGLKGLETLPNLIVAVLVILVSGLTAKLVRKLVTGLLARTPTPVPVRNLISAFAGVTTVGAGLLIALGVLGLEKTVTSLLAGVGIVGLALGFAFQDIAANFMAGLLMSFRRPIQVGEIIETQDFFGIVGGERLREHLAAGPPAHPAESHQGGEGSG